MFHARLEGTPELIRLLWAIEENSPDFLESEMLLFDLTDGRLTLDNCYHLKKTKRQQNQICSFKRCRCLALRDSTYIHD